MGRLSRAAGRGAAYLMTAERRDWAEAVWAEAHEVPPGLRRLAWRAGGVRLIARESPMVRRVRNSLVFAVAAGYLVWTALPGTASPVMTADIWLRATGTVLVLAGLPWLVRRLLGPVIESRLARSLRAGTFAAIMALVVALAAIERMTNTPGRLAAAGPHNQPSISMLGMSSVFLLAVACYAAGLLAVTAKRFRVTPATLSIGTGLGVALGAVMYAIMPLGFETRATAPWLRGSATDPVVAMAWVLLFGGPLAAALLAGWRCRAAVGPLTPADARIRQGMAAGTLVTLVASLVVCALGPATLASVTTFAHVLFPGQHLTSAMIAHRAATMAGYGTSGYALVWFFFPVIGLSVGALTAMGAWGNQAVRQQGQGPGGPGGPGPELAPGPPAGGLSTAVPEEAGSVAAGLYAAARGS